MSTHRGQFVVIEGIDGSGTTTQAGRLAARLAEGGPAPWQTFEPTDGPVGRLIRDGLSGRLLSHETGEPLRLHEDALCLLFAADRIAHTRRIEEERDAGRHVVSDRYLLSSIAYQSCDPIITPERVIDLNDGCAIPTVTLLLRVPVDRCLARLENRGDSPTVYERKDLLEAIDRNYTDTSALYESRFGPVIEIDGTPSAEEVHTAIVERLRRYLPV